MPWDDDADDDVPPARPPLPPEDRLWRHPSELGGATLAAAPGAARRQPTWATAVVAGLVGATLTAAVVVAVGAMPSRVVERTVVEKVALTPVVSSPTLRSEAGVAAVAERLGPAIARLELTTDDGPAARSAVLFRDDGMLLTSAYLLDRTTSVTVVLSDGRRFEGRLVGLDPLTDIAVVGIDGEDLPVVVLGSSSDLRVGATTIAIGAPLGSGGGASVTTGVITALGRRVDAAGGHTLHGVIQVDGTIAPASAGGALLDSSGAVVGITTAAVGGHDSRFGFAVPIELARRVAADLVATGHTSHSWLGVRGADLSGAAKDGLGIEGGARVREVADGSPAERAGLRAEDVITEVDGEEVGSISGLVLEMRDRRPGDEVEIGYWRGDAHQETSVVLGERP